MIFPLTIKRKSFPALFPPIITVQSGMLYRKKIHIKPFSQLYRQSEAINRKKNGNKYTLKPSKRFSTLTILNVKRYYCNYFFQSYYFFAH